MENGTPFRLFYIGRNRSSGLRKTELCSVYFILAGIGVPASGKWNSVPFILLAGIGVPASDSVYFIGRNRSSGLLNSSPASRFSTHSVFFPMFSSPHKVIKKLLFRGQANIVRKLRFAHSDRRRT